MGIEGYRSAESNEQQEQQEQNEGPRTEEVQKLDTRHFTPDRIGELFTTKEAEVDGLNNLYELKKDDGLKDREADFMKSWYETIINDAQTELFEDYRELSDGFGSFLENPSDPGRESRFELNPEDSEEARLTPMGVARCREITERAGKRYDLLNGCRLSHEINGPFAELNEQFLDFYDQNRLIEATARDFLPTEAINWHPSDVGGPTFEEYVAEQGYELGDDDYDVEQVHADYMATHGKTTEFSPYDRVAVIEHRMNDLDNLSTSLG